MPPRHHREGCNCVVCAYARREQAPVPRNHRPRCRCVVCRRAREEGTVGILVRVPYSMQERMHELMVEAQCSQSELVRRAIGEYLRRQIRRLSHTAKLEG